MLVIEMSSKGWDMADPLNATARRIWSARHPGSELGVGVGVGEGNGFGTGVRFGWRGRVLCTTSGPGEAISGDRVAPHDAKDAPSATASNDAAIGLRRIWAPTSSQQVTSVTSWEAQRLRGSARRARARAAPRTVDLARARKQAKAQDVAKAVGCTPTGGPEPHPDHGYTLLTCTYRGDRLAIYWLHGKTFGYMGEPWSEQELWSRHSRWNIACSAHADCVQVQRIIGGRLTAKIKPPASDG
jgi:hypothetical protein